MNQNTPSRFASIFYAGFVILALCGAVWAVVEDPGGKYRVSLYGKSSVVGDTPVAVNSDGEVGIHDGGNTITVDGTVTVTDGAGALNVIVDSITAGNNNIGDVDVASLPALPAGDNDIGNVDLEFAGSAASTNNGAADATTQRVTIANNSTGILAAVTSITNAVTVTDGAGALNVIVDSGTTTVTQGTATNLKAEVIGTGTFSVQCTSGCGGSGGTASDFDDTFPVEGTAVGMSDGMNMVPLTTTDGTSLDVNCVVGCAGGTFNNNADDVATSADNGKSAAWLYLWDGAAWDRAPGNSTDGLTVNLGANNDVVASNGGTFVVQENGSALTALQLIDDTVHIDDTATHATGTTKGVGIMAAATPTDASVSANDIGMVAMTTDRKLHVAVMDALPAGSAAIGKLAANSGVDIGDVDVTSIAAGNNNIGDVDVASIAAGDNNIGNVDIVSGTITTVTTVTNVTGGTTAHDGGGGSINPIATGCYSSAAAPTDVNADTDITREWCLRNGSRAVTVTAAGALIGGDATNGLDVDVTRMSALVAGTADIGDVDLELAGTAVSAGNGTSDSGTIRVAIASNNTGVANMGHGATSSAVPAGATMSGFRSDGGHAAGTASLKTPEICQDSAVISAASSGNNEIVALTASETVYVCGFLLISDGTVGVQFITGTGTACATGETDKTGVMSLVANSGFSSFSPFPITKGAAGDAFCIELSGNVQVSGILNYTKF